MCVCHTITGVTHISFLFFKAEGLTAVETWVVSCIIHVFGVLAEYALILKMIQDLKRQETKSLKERKERVSKGKGEIRENCDYQGVYKQVGMLHFIWSSW